MNLFDNLEIQLDSCLIKNSKGNGGCKKKMNAAGTSPKTEVIGLITIPYTYPKVKQPSIFEQKYPNIKTLCDTIAQTHFPDLEYTHIQINKNFQTLPHRDKRNEGDSAIFTLGSFTGGELVIENVTHNIYKNPLIFNGYINKHWTNPFVGTRYSVIYFKNSNV